MPVRCLHDIQPLLAGAFEGGDPLPDGIHENLGATARDGPQTRRFELADHVRDRQLKYLRKMSKLWRRKPVDIDLRKILPEIAQEVQVIIDAKLRMVTALEEYLNATNRHQLPHLCSHLFDGEDVGVGRFGVTHEGAKRAVDIADIGVIDVAVDDVGHALVRVQPLPNCVGQGAQFRQAQCLVELQCLARRNANACEHLGLD